MSDAEPLPPLRRLAAILAADIAGYSRLVGDDEEGTLRRVKAILAGLVEPKIAAHRGRLVKTTGDGLLIEFGSVVDALRCASEVQADMAQRDASEPPDRRIQFRIGIHQGDIVFDNDDIFGNGVNIAARLEGIADPGGICVSARVQEDAVGRIELSFEDIGEQALKNIARPVRAFRVRPADRPELAASPAEVFHPNVPAALATVPASARGLTASAERLRSSIDRIQVPGTAVAGFPQPYGKAARSPYAWLLAEPRRFRFDAAVRILTRAAKTSDPAEAVRFRSSPGLAYPAAEVAAIGRASCRERV